MPAMHVPDRWRDYSSFHQCIDKTRILAVKTPLKKNFNNGLSRSEMERQRVEHGVPLEEEFTPTNLIEGVARMGRGYRLGLVIDLTNTNRYYDHKELSSADVKYEKLKCVGQQTPSDEIYARLSEILNSFLSENKTGIAVVHCTHGLNRTGYLVCRYLIEYCDYKVEAAIKAFETARGHKIEKYLDHLRKGCPKLPDPSPNEGAHHLGDDRGGHGVSKFGVSFYQRESDSRGRPRRRSDRGNWMGGDRRQSERDEDWRRRDNPSNAYHTNDHTWDGERYHQSGARGRTSRRWGDHRSGSDRHDVHSLEYQTRDMHVDQNYVGSDQYQHSGSYVGDQYQHSGSYVGDQYQHSGSYVGDQYQHSGSYVGDQYQHSGSYTGQYQHSGPYEGSGQHYRGSHQYHGRSYGDSEQQRSSSYEKRTRRTDKRDKQ